MATITYKLVDLSTGTIYDTPKETPPDIIVTLYPSAEDTSVAVCWGGITHTKDTCRDDEYESTYCENVFIGANTDCENVKQIDGTFEWHGFTIQYLITQGKATCNCCKTAPPCELIDYIADPYYLPYCANTTSNIYYSYWQYSLNSSECIVTRTKKTGSTSVSFTTADTKIACDNNDRTISKSISIGCGSKNFEWYVKKPNDCCDDPTECTCYDISDIYYSPSIVPSSGANVSFYFDYKKITRKDCKQKITFGRYSSGWTIPPCDEEEETAPQRCCKDHTETILLSGITSDWNDKLLCDRKGLCSDEKVSGITLSITQTRDPNFTGDCGNVCDPDTGYCVTKDTITTWHKDDDDNWIPWGFYDEANDKWKWGKWDYDATTDEWTRTGEIDEKDAYEMPYFGGSMRVTWNYSAFTVYDDCTTAMTTGNIWEDVYDILPYTGDCYDETANQCGNISLGSENGNKCDGGNATFSFTPNTDIEKDYVIEDIPVIFKKALCELAEITKFPCETRTDECCDKGGCEEETQEEEQECGCNRFTLSYKQKKKPCSDDCESCIKPHTETGLCICEHCDYVALGDEDGNCLIDKCPICESTNLKSKQKIDDTFIYYADTGITEIVDTDAYDTDCTIRVINKPEWVTEVIIDSGKITFKLNENKKSDREGGVTFQLNGKDCYDTVVIHQTGANEPDPPQPYPPVECTCDATFEVFSTNYNLDANGSGEGLMAIGSYIFDECIDESLITVGDEKCCKITANTDTTDCEGDVQFGISKDCGGGSCSINADRISITCSGTLNLTVTQGGGGSAISWISGIKFEDNTIWGIVEANTSDTERSGQLTIMHQDSDGNQCEGKTITITQNGGGSEGCGLTLSVEGIPTPGSTIIITHS